MDCGTGRPEFIAKGRKQGKAPQISDWLSCLHDGGTHIFFFRAVMEIERNTLPQMSINNACPLNHVAPSGTPLV